MRTESEANQALAQYSDLVKRICVLHLKNPEDTKDVFQNVFLKYILYSGSFENEEHERAWFIRVTINACKDWIKSLSRHPFISLETASEIISTTSSMDNPETYSFISNQNREVLSAVLSLPNKYKDVIYLFYYEEYSAVEIARLLNKKENTIYSLLSRAKKLLKEKLGGEEFE